MCDFKVGDEVVCIDGHDCPELTVGAVYVVSRVIAPGECVDFCNGWSFVEGSALWVVGGYDFYNSIDGSGYRADRFRKVIRRDLSAWLENSTDFEEPKRVPAEVDA